MNDQHLKVSDFVAASVPVAAGKTAGVVAALTLSDWQSIASIAGTLLGAAYLLWRWRRDAKRNSNHPFSRE